MASDGSAGGMTTRRWLRGTLRAGLGLLAALVLVALLVVWLDPSARLVVRVLLQPLVATTHPPAMFADALAGSQPRDWAETDRRLTARLQQEFPLGTSEDTLTKALRAEGFKPSPPPPSNCVPPVQNGEPVHAAKHAAICPPQDDRKSLQYAWGGGGCDRTITVRWSADARGTVTLLDGHYYAACL